MACSVYPCVCVYGAREWRGVEWIDFLLFLFIWKTRRSTGRLCRSSMLLLLSMYVEGWLRSSVEACTLIACMRVVFFFSFGCTGSFQYPDVCGGYSEEWTSCWGEASHGRRRKASSHHGKSTALRRKIHTIPPSQVCQTTGIRGAHASVYRDRSTPLLV